MGRSGKVSPMSRTPKPKVASLFAGIGGFDLGFEFAGWQTTAIVEIDAACRQVLSTRFPLAKIFADVCEVKGEDLGDPDCITAGVPCQDVSIAGRRAGLAGARTGLFFEFARLLDETKAEWFVFENVPGLMSSNQGRDFGTVVGTLADLGYGLCWRVLDSQFFGLAQRRKRLFIVGHLGDLWGPAQVLLEPDSGQGNPPSRRAKGASLASVLAASADGVGGDGDGDGDGRATVAPVEVANALTSNGVGTCGADDNQAQAGHLIPSFNMEALYDDEGKPELAGTLGGGNYGTGRRSEDDPNLVYGLHNHTGEELDVAPTLDARARNGPIQEQQGVMVAHLIRMREGKDGGGKGPLISEEMSLTLATGNDQTLVIAPEADVRGYDFVQVTSKTNRSNPKAGDPYPTLAQMSEPHVAFNKPHAIVRRLTPLEAERLQGFPDGWTRVLNTDTGQVDAKDGTRYKQLGNAVSVPVVKWIGARMREYIETGQVLPRKGGTDGR